MQIILARQAFGKGSNKGPSHNITIRMTENSNCFKDNIADTLLWSTALKFLKEFDVNRHAYVSDRIYDSKDSILFNFLV